MPDLDIINRKTLPLAAGLAFFQRFSEEATVARFDPMVLFFGDSGTRIGVNGSFTVPQNYSSGAILLIVWTAVPTTGDVPWDFEYRAVGGNDIESLDQTGQQEQLTVTDTVGSATLERMEATISLTDGNFAAGDTVQFELMRDGAQAADTLADVAILWDAFFRYTAS